MLPPTLLLFNQKSSVLEVISITPEQNKLLGQLLTAGVPLPIALPIALDPQAATAGIRDGVALFEQGADAALNIIPTLAKKTKRRSKKNPKLKKALTEANRRMRLKNGKLRKGKTQGDVMRLAHRLMKKM